MALFDAWCASEKEETGRKRYWTLVEKAGGRDAKRLQQSNDDRGIERVLIGSNSAADRLGNRRGQRLSAVHQVAHPSRKTERALRPALLVTALALDERPGSRWCFSFLEGQLLLAFCFEQLWAQTLHFWQWASNDRQCRRILGPRHSRTRYERCREERPSGLPNLHQEICRGARETVCR
jgi:hypothetical protein